MIFENDVLVIKYGEKTINERILKICENGLCYTITLNSSKLQICKRDLKGLEKDIEEDLIQIASCYNTYDIISDEKIKESYRSKRDFAYQIVKFITDSMKEPDIYKSEYLGPIVKQAVEKFSISDVTIYKYWRQYLQSGKMKNALLPRYYKCGTHGKEIHYRKKTGRPSNEAILDGESKGLILTRELMF